VLERRTPFSKWATFLVAMMTFFDEPQDAHPFRRSPTTSRDINGNLTHDTLSGRLVCGTLKPMSSWVHVALVSIAWQWLPAFDIGPLEREAKPPVAAREERTPERTTMTPPSAPHPERLAQLPDEVVVRALDGGRAGFIGCWKRALKADPMLDATKVKLRVELDAFGSVVAVTHDAANQRLGNCLMTVARGLKFTAPQAAAVAEFPLFFQAE